MLKELEIDPCWDNSIEKTLPPGSGNYLAVAKNPDSTSQETEFIILHFPEGRDGCSRLKIKVCSHKDVMLFLASLVEPKTRGRVMDQNIALRGMFNKILAGQVFAQTHVLA